MEENSRGKQRQQHTHLLLLLHTVEHGGQLIGGLKESLPLSSSRNLQHSTTTGALLQEAGTSSYCGNNCKGGRQLEGAVLY